MRVATVKRSISFDPDLLAEAERLADGNLSAYVNDALLQHVKSAGLRVLLQELDAEHGPVSDDVKKEVDGEWRALRWTPEP